MKDLDTLLQNHAARPRRELSANFTARVVADIKAQPSQPRKERTLMKRKLAPLIASIAAVVVLLGGGVTYAATDGFTKPFNLNNIFGYKTIEEKSGEKVLAVQTASCTVGTTDSPTDNSDQTLYFRLKDTSVSETDTLRWLQGYCESIDSDNLNTQFHEASEGAYIGGGTVESMDGDVLTVSWKLGEGNDTKTQTETYRISNDTVIKRSKNVSSTFTKGDAVLIVSDYDESNPDATKPARYIVHRSSDVQFYQDNFDKYHAALERVKPCEGEGFCAYDSTAGYIDTTDKQATDFVKNAYEPYKTSIESLNSETWESGYQAAQSAFVEHTTPQLGAKLKGAYPGDPILCAQNMTPGKLSYGTPVTHGTTIVVPVLRPTLVGEMREDGTGDMQQKVFADVSYSTTLKKITSIDCTHTLAE